ncbi:Glycerol-3-phosphate dehydrogenase [Nowakowskiella sp. JEL0407]|nr:Glycerol-3-phosphate dehydrogenase [Nowakowskiella sp. JEL0407]
MPTTESAEYFDSPSIKSDSSFSMSGNSPLPHSLFPNLHRPITPFMESAEYATPVKEKVAIVGSGNWGTTVAKIVGNNVLGQLDTFNRVVQMWVHEEIVNGRKLTDIINNDRENVKYLPGIKLPENVVADSDISSAIRNATLIIFVIPHQFITQICEKIVKSTSIHPLARGISLIKGVDLRNGSISLFTDTISRLLNIRMSVLSGANIASEIAAEQFCETTIGYRDKDDAVMFQTIFQTSYFRVNIVEDIAGVEICGALKNVVAIGAGIIDGLQLGENSKAAIIRIGLSEIRKFAKHFFEEVKDETFFESCGVADVITSCFGGRNRMVAEAFVKTGKSFEELEMELLNGQKIQGTLTAKEVHAILKQSNLVDQ